MIVGTWVRLLKEALRTYALPQPAADPNSFRDALGTFRHAFWSKSLTAAPEETAHKLKVYPPMEILRFAQFIKTGADS